MKAKKSNNAQNIKDWFEKASHDFTTAKVAFDSGGEMDSIAMLLQQAVEKYLKGFLISRGWRLKKTHDLEELVAETIKHDESFEKFLMLAQFLTASYVEDRYPYSAQVMPSKGEIAESIKGCEKLIAKLKSIL